MSFLFFLSSVSISVSCCSWLFSGFVYSCVPYTYTFEIFIYGLDWRCLSFMYFFHVVHDSFLDSFIHVYYYTLLRFSYVVNLIVMDIFRLYLIMNLVTFSFFFFFSSVFFFLGRWRGLLTILIWPIFAFFFFLFLMWSLLFFQWMKTGFSIRKKVICRYASSDVWRFIFICV